MYLYDVISATTPEFAIAAGATLALGAVCVAGYHKLTSTKAVQEVDEVLKENTESQFAVDNEHLSKYGPVLEETKRRSVASLSTVAAIAEPKVASTSESAVALTAKSTGASKKESVDASMIVPNASNSAAGTVAIAGAVGVAVMGAMALGNTAGNVAGRQPDSQPASQKKAAKVADAEKKPSVVKKGHPMAVFGSVKTDKNGHPMAAFRSVKMGNKAM